MEIPILIEPIEGGRFRAKAGEPLALSAEGTTKEEAFSNLKRQVGERLNNGAELMGLTLGRPALEAEFSQPVLADDLYQTDWVYKELQESIAENRRIEEETDS